MRGGLEIRTVIKSQVKQRKSALRDVGIANNDCNNIIRAVAGVLTPALSPLGNRGLDINQLTALKVGVFDKNTALSFLYVD